ncbi:VapE domain-containing protein [Psychroserpens sp. AS72]|uniref:VapE domain-containing protein n=1 Tax=Psychroserpens sp. AS72 TaxID=3135775 RepID=UPI00316AF1EC
MKKAKTNNTTVEGYLKNKYNFRYNIFTSAVEFHSKTEKKFKVMKDFDLRSLVRELNANNYNISKSRLDDLFKSDFSYVYHPLKEYLKSLPEWDKTDYISELAARVKTDDDDFFTDAFKRWFVAMVGCGIEDNIFNHTMIIFSGGQGLGKSTFIRSLLPKELDKYSYSGMINPNSKDTLVHLSECLIIDLDELSSLTRRENNDVKELITKSKIKIRRPYGRISENLARRASFVGSLNEDKFLTDLSGNRRFLSFKVESIDYKNPVNYKGVYSQALALYKSGFKFYFDGEEINKINERNEIFRSKSTIEELVLSKYIPAINKYEAEFYLNSSELLLKLNNSANIQMSNTNSIQLGKVLKKLGFENIKKNGIQKYAIDIIKHYDSENQQNLKKIS